MNYYVFSSLKGFLLFLLVLFITICLGAIREAPLFIGIFALIYCLIYFKDYKIVIDKEKITFYSVLKKKKYFHWTDINKLEIEEEIKLGRLGSIENLNVYTNKGIFTFNINSLEKKALFSTLINFCSYHNILITNLNIAK